MKLSPLDLTPFIRELVLMNECIILRGVGGFETQYKNAVWDKKKKVLIPPGKQIIFREEWIQDNGVLENHIAEELDISHEQASDLIDEFVKQFYESLKEEGSVILEGIGRFSLDDKARLGFEELGGANYLADSYGLDTLDLGSEPVTSGSPSEAALKPIEPSGRKSTSLYIIIGILLLVISVTLIILLSEGGNFKILSFDKHAGGKPLVIGNREAVSKDSGNQVIEERLDRNTSARVALGYQEEEKEEETGAQETPSGPVYYLIAGSFKNLNSAEILKKDLLDEGFEAEVIHMDNRFRVVIGTFYDQDLAMEELRRLRKQIDKSIWPLKKP